MNSTETCSYSNVFLSYASILAAASPVFASIFADCPIIEEDVRVTVAGYSYEALRAVVQYIYTGSLSCTVEEKVTLFSQAQ